MSGGWWLTSSAEGEEAASNELKRLSGYATAQLHVAERVCDAGADAADAQRQAGPARAARSRCCAALAGGGLRRSGNSAAAVAGRALATDPAGGPVGIHDNFFAIGGDSIRAAIFINKLQQLLGEYLYVVALFDAPTIAELAAYLEVNYPQAVARLTRRLAAGAGRERGGGG